RGENVHPAVVVPSADGYAHAAGETRIVCEKAGKAQRGYRNGNRVWRRRQAGLPDGYFRSAAGARAGDDFRPAVIVEIGRRDVNAAGEAWIESEEVADERGIGTVKVGHVRPAAGSGAGDNVGDAAGSDIAGRDADAAGELRMEGEEVGEHGAVLAAEYDDVGSAAGVGAGDDVGTAVAVHIAGGD